MATTSTLTSRIPFPPRQITEDAYNAYSGLSGTSGWKQLIEQGTIEALQDAFKSGDGNLMNYVYLDYNALNALLATSTPNPKYHAADCIITMFVLVPSADTTESPVFSMVVFRASNDGVCVSDYYLAGVAAVPSPPPPLLTPQLGNSKIPTPDADIMMRAWDALKLYGVEKLPTFYAESVSGTETYLMGRVFQLSDFTQSWLAQPSPGNADALWLFFDLHDQNGGCTDPHYFDLVVQRDTTPGSGDRQTTLVSQPAFYDVSKPCPPYYSYTSTHPPQPQP